MAESTSTPIFIYCSKCKKKTESKRVERLMTANHKWRLKAVCTVCKREKSMFIKAPERSSSLSSSKTEKKEKKLLAPARVLVEAHELHRGVVTKFPRRQIVTRCIDDLWAADLVIMNKYAADNDGYKYMLNVIDTFSKYAWSEPMFRKSGPDTARAFRSIVQRAVSRGGGVAGHRPPKLLHTDKGREFVNADFKRTLRDLGDIKLYHTENEEKSAIVERFNRTLNQWMRVEFEARKSYRWVDILEPLLKRYNESVHSTIRMRPVDVNAGCESDLQRLYTDRAMKHIAKVTTNSKKWNRWRRQPVENKFKIGDRVRIVKKKDQFADKYSHNWSREIFRVSQVMSTAPVTYKITDAAGEEIIGSFYEKELQKTAL